MMNTRNTLMPAQGRTTTRAGRRLSFLPVVLAAVATAVAGGPASAAPAAAAPAGASQAGCTAVASVCLYAGENFAGASLPFGSLAPGGTCVNLAESGWSGPVRSVVSTHSRSAALFANEDCLGGPYQVAANSSILSLGTFVPKSLWVAG